MESMLVFCSHVNCTTKLSHHFYKRLRTNSHFLQTVGGWTFGYPQGIKKELEIDKEISLVASVNA